MNDGLTDLVELLARSVLWSVARRVVLDHPALVIPFAVVAAVAFVVVRSRGRSRRMAR